MHCASDERTSRFRIGLIQNASGWLAREDTFMATIAVGRDVLTLINVFTVKPENQQALVQLLVDATEQTMRHVPGFISASIHKSHDGTKVVNYAQWRSQKDFDAMRQDPKARAHMAAAAALATFEPILCEVAESIGGS
jgi:quinol monooxygenase YgiN